MFKLPVSLVVFLTLISAISRTWAVNWNIYNPAYSSMVNWGDPNRGPDQTISIPYSGTTATATTAVTVAGSVVSLKMGTKEFIASGGHGSGLGWTLKPELPGYPIGECYNPTSGGTAGDDQRPGWNTPPYHGPSTSAILQPLSQRPGDQLVTNARMAFYVPPGWTGFGGCIGNYPADPSYTYGEGYGILSPFVLGQNVSFGRQTDVGWLPNVLNVQASTALDSTAFVHGDIYDNVGIAYLLSDFTNFYAFNGNQTAPDHGLQPVARESQGFYDGRMPVIATANGAYAMGLIEGQSAQEARNVQQGTLPAHNERHYYWIEYNVGYDDGGNYFQLQTMQVTFYHTTPAGQDCRWTTCENFSPGTTLKHTMHYVFGNLTQVQAGLQALYDDQHGLFDPDVFNWQEYITRYPDVPAVFPTQTRTEDHWLVWGINEGRQGSNMFSAPAYRAANPSVNTACGGSNRCAILHYVNYGRAAGLPLWPPK